MFSSDLLNKEDLEVCNVGNLMVADRCCSSSQFYGGDGYCGDVDYSGLNQTRDDEVESTEQDM